MQRNHASKSEPKTSSRAKWLLAGALLFAKAGGAAAWHFTHTAEDPEVTKAIELQNKLFADMARDEGANGSRVINATPTGATPRSQPLSPTERELVAGELRQQMEKLSEEQRREVREQMGDSFRQRMHEMIDAYHALPKNERTAFLDKEIDRWEKRRAEFTRNRERQEGRGGSQTSGAAQANGGAPGGGSGSPPPNRGPRGDGSPEQRNEHRRERLANSTPEDRAKFASFFSDMNARRKARGLEEMGRRGR